jgi:Heavy metal associated domain 2
MRKTLTALNCQIVHQIPGRMRIKLPNLFDIPANVERLQQNITALQGVRNLRINPAAKSITIEYQEKQISELDLQKQLAAILTKIALKTPGVTSNEPIATQSISLEKVNFLTAYEQTQLEEIERWRSQEPQFLLAIATIAIPIKTLSDWLVPEVVIEQSLALCDVLASRWQEDWESLKREAGVKTPIELQQTELEVCDRHGSNAIGKTASFFSFLSLAKYALPTYYD